MLEQLRVKPGSSPRLADRDPRDELGLDKAEGNVRLAQLRERIEELQYRLFAERRRSVLLVLQGLDASGKDGVVRRVFEGVNPAGVRVVSFRAPAGVEQEHDYLWRIQAALPRFGEIGVFNRSHYEDVVAVRMRELAPEQVWRRRPRHLVDFERMLVDEGTTLVKAFLNVSRAEQAKRLRERLEDPEKQWKFRAEDLTVSASFDDWLQAWEDVLEETSTEHAPWYVIPADRNWVKALAIATLVVDALERIDPQLPQPDPGVATATA